MAQVPHAEEGLICPFHKKDMSTVCHKCPMWQRFVGHDPNTNQETDAWGCSLSMLAKCSLETAKRTTNGLDGVQKATESFRNEMVAQNHRTAQQLIEGVEK